MPTPCSNALGLLPRIHMCSHHMYTHISRYVCMNMPKHNRALAWNIHVHAIFTNVFPDMFGYMNSSSYPSPRIWFSTPHSHTCIYAYSRTWARVSKRTRALAWNIFTPYLHTHMYIYLHLSARKSKRTGALAWTHPRLENICTPLA